MDTLAKAWLPGLTDQELQHTCSQYAKDLGSGGATYTACRHIPENHFKHCEDIYRYVIQGFPDTASRLYNSVIEPVLGDPAPLISNADTPHRFAWRTARKTLSISGTEPKRAKRGHYQLAPFAPDTWNVSRPSYVSERLDLSLVIKPFVCYMHRTVSIRFWKDAGSAPLTETQNIHCSWVPKIPRGCNCAAEIENYANPMGMCSPDCVKPGRGKVTVSNWVLRLSREAPNVTVPSRGRNLWGVTSPSTERFCLVTERLFLGWGPAEQSGSAPLDAHTCNVVLVEIRVMTNITKGDTSSIMLVSGRHADDLGYLYISERAVNTVRTIIRQAWNMKLGMRLRFDVPPKAIHVASVLDWMINPDGGARQLRLVVIDLAVEDISADDFATLHSIYGSEIAITPGIDGANYAQHIYDRNLLGSRCKDCLDNLGRVTTKHRAFLDTETVGVFPEDEVGCEDVPVGRWMDGPVSGNVFNSDSPWLLRTGVTLFEDLCERRNNRAGIVVSLPTARYRRHNCLASTGSVCHKWGGERGCTRLDALNRHGLILGDYEDASHRWDIVYTMPRLEQIIGSMLRRGVRIYSMGYLDYMYSLKSVTGGSTFKTISSKESYRRLYYIYTYVTDSMETYPWTKIDRLYKLKRGVFFQKQYASQSSGFISISHLVPGVQGSPPETFELVTDVPEGICAVAVQSPGKVFSLPVCPSPSSSCRPLVYIKNANTNWDIAVYVPMTYVADNSSRVPGAGMVLSDRNGEPWFEETLNPNASRGPECFSGVWLDRIETMISLNSVKPNTAVSWLGYSVDGANRSSSSPIKDIDMAKLAVEDVGSARLGVRV
ncbi:hypothetical protein AAFF_G00171560 [Aldrovandia affinis]|uniref:Uncharacterized protein n=1 Tax=Aldrovandia affinis TaxID=143900 RepID=A0AAD7WW34_9TELE|nr:hypothetical protein AAFF_G00171560 [Aldrovandia affinis]